MAASFTLYNHTALRIADATSIIKATNSFKVSLHTSTYTPSAAHAVYANLTNELTTANGYTSGGLALANMTLATVTTNDLKFDADDSVWTATGGSIAAWRYAVVRAVGTLNGLVDPLIGYILGDTTPADIAATTVGNTLTIQWNAAGIVTGTVA